MHKLIIENITNMTSNLKQSNLTSLSSNQKKIQEKSLEEQVYEMPIENIEAERLRKTFLRICGDKVNSAKSGDKESFNKKPYLCLYLVSPLIRKMSLESWLSWASLTISRRSSSGFGKWMRIWMGKSMNMNLPWCIRDAFSIRLGSSLVTFSILSNFWCTTSPAEIKSQSKTLLSWFMSEILMLICCSNTFLRFLQVLWKDWGWAIALDFVRWVPEADAKEWFVEEKKVGKRAQNCDSGDRKEGRDWLIAHFVILFDTFSYLINFNIYNK